MNAGILAPRIGPVLMPRALLGLPLAVPMPDQPIHIEADDWRRRVQAVGGTISTATLAEVSRFCYAIESANLRDRFYRLNLFAGDNLAAALVPLFLSESRNAPARGRTTDTNNNFNGNDYNETGTTGGLRGAIYTAAKSLQTGLPTNSLQTGNNHVSAYALDVSPAFFLNPSPPLLGWVAGDGRTVNLQNYLLAGNSLSTTFFGGPRNVTAAPSYSSANPVGLIVGASESTSLRRLYIGGTQVAENTAFDDTAATPQTNGYFIFTAGNNNFYNGRIGGYSLGLSMTPLQVSQYTAIVQTFQAALSRAV